MMDIEIFSWYIFLDIFAIMNNSSMNISIKELFLICMNISVSYIHKSGKAGSNDMYFLYLDIYC